MTNLVEYLKKKQELKELIKIYLDAGHGGVDTGANGNGLREKDLTLTLVKKIDKLLKDYQGVETKLSRSTDKTVSLDQRTHEANKWGADFLLSVHINAFGDKDGDGDGDGYGYEDFMNDKVHKDSISPEVQKVIHGEMVKVLGKDFHDRGAKKKNLHMLRESNMGAVLTESGFIDNSKDAKLLKSDAFLDKVAKAHVKGLVKAFNLKKKEVEKPVVKPVEKPTHKNNHTHYTVILGDTLSSIAMNYGVSVGEILEINPDIKNRNQIYVGNLLNIPLK